MTSRLLLLTLLLGSAMTVGLACGVTSPLTVQITIPVAISDMTAGPDTALYGFVQGYVRTPTAEAAARQGNQPIITQAPDAVEGYGVPTVSVTIRVPTQSGAVTRLDELGFFSFSGFPPDSPPVQTLIEFPGGSFSDQLTEVPIVPQERDGFSVQKIDLEQNTQYSNNSKDIRSMSDAKMNLGLSSSQGGRIQLYVSGRGDLTRAQVLEGQEASMLLDHDLQPGQSRQLRDINPLNESDLLRLATPADGTRMFFLYLVAQDASDPESSADVAVSGVEFIFRARVSAPL